MVDVWSIFTNVIKGLSKAGWNMNRAKEKINSSPSSDEEKKEKERLAAAEAAKKKAEEAAKKAEEERKKAEAEQKKKEEAAKKAAEEAKRKEEEKNLTDFQVTQKRQEETKKKIETSPSYRKEVTKEMNTSENANIWNTWELGWTQTGKSISRAWEWFNERTKKRAEDQKKAKWFWENALTFWKNYLENWVDLWYTTLKTAGKAVWWVLDVTKEWFTTAADMVQHLSWNKWIENRQNRINKILEEHANQKNTVQNTTTERIIEEWKNVNELWEKMSNAWQEAINLTKERQTIEKEIEELDKQKESWAVTGPEWEANYNARKKELSNKKTSVAKAVLLFEKIRDEYIEKSNEHKIKEQEALPFTMWFYETEDEAKYYREHFADKLYKNEDWTYYWLINPTLTWDEEQDAKNAYEFNKQADIRNVLMWLERWLFQEMEWVRNQTEWVSNILWIPGLSSSKIDFDMRAPFLKNSDFLDRAYIEFDGVKKLLEDNYDKLLKQEVWADGQMNTSLDLDKVNQLLQANRAWLNKLWDEIVQKKSFTQYVDYQTERWYKNSWDDSAIMWLQENAAKKKDLIFSFSESVSRWKTTTKGPQTFSYSRAWDWINQATDQYWVTDAIWRMFATNPGQTAYVLWSSYFAIFGKLWWGVKWAPTSKLLQTKDWLKVVEQAGKAKAIWYTGVTRWSSKMDNMITAENAINNAKWIGNLWAKMAWTKAFWWMWKENLIAGIDRTARMWYGTIDEMLVSLPLDLWLSDWTAQDMWMNIWFNTLWWIWKISSAPEMVKFTRNLVTEPTPEARKVYFIEQTWLKDLADTIDFSQDAEKVAADVSYKINSHIKNILSTDKNKAAFFMSQYLMDNVDNLKWEHADSIKVVVDAITEDGNIWTSLGKNRAKNIQNIINKANKELEWVKDWATKLSIQNNAIKQIQGEFKWLLETFDSNKIKKFFDHDFAREKVSQAFANIFQELENKTWTSKEWRALAYLWATANNTKYNKAVTANLLDIYKKALAAWEVNSTKPVVEAARAAEETIEDVSWDLNIVQKVTDLWAQWKHTEAAELIQQAQTQFFKAQRKINKSELSKVTKEIEAEEKAAKKAADKAAKTAEKKALEVANKARSAETLEEKWRAVLDYAKKISEDKELKEEIEKAKEDYLDDFRNDEAIIEEAESRWLTLDEFLEKEWIAKESFNYQQVIENYIVRKYFNVDYLKKRYWEDELQNIAERVFWTTDVERLNDIWIKDLYRIDMFEEGKRVDKWRQALSSIQDIFTSKDNIWQKWWVTLEWTYKLTDEEKKLIREKIEDLQPIFEKITGKSSTSKKFTDTQNESIEKLLQYVEKWELNKEDIEDIIKIISDDDDIIFNIKNSYVDYVDWKVGSDIRNPYKVFSDKVADYIKNPDEMRSVIKKWEIEWYDKNWKPIIAKEDKVIKTWVESKFTKNFDKDDKVERELEKIIETITDADVAAKKADAAKAAEEAVVKMDMTSEGKKTKWAYQEIIKGADEFLDFMEANETVTKKSGLTNAVATILEQIKNVSTERRFLWSLWKIVQNMVETATSKWAKRAVNRTVFKNELWKALYDVVPEADKTTLRNEIKKVVTDKDGNINMEDVKNLVGNWTYKINAATYENMAKANQTDDLLNKIIQDKITSGLWNTKNQPLDNDRYGKVADVINRLTAQANELYWRLWESVAIKYWINPDVFMDKVKLADAIDEVSRQNSKAVKTVEEITPEETDIAEDLQKVIDTNMDVDGKPIDTVKNLTEWNNAEEKIALSNANKEEKTEKLTSPYDGPLSHHDKTLMKFGGVEEAANIMKQISNGKIPEDIWAEFLDNDWFTFLEKLLRESGMDNKQFKLFYDGFLKAKKQMQGFWYSAFYWLNHMLYDWSSTLKTSSNWWSLSSILKAIPVRISSSMKSARTWGIIYDARATLTKYIMESNPEEGRKIMQDFLTKEYLPTALNKAFNDETAVNFLKATNTELMEWESEASAVARALMNIYDESAKELRNTWLSERLIHDILNPILYNPMEYISGLGKSSSLKEIVANKTVLWTVLIKYENQWNNLPEALLKLKIDNEAYAKMFNAFSAWAPIRNKYAYEVWEAFGKYLDKIDSIPMGREQFAEYLNKTLGHIVNWWDDVVRAVTAFDNSLYPIVVKAREKLGDESANFISRMWDVLNNETSFFSKNKAAKEKAIAELDELIKAYKINDDETKEIIEVIQKSLDEVSESKDERVLVNYLYDSVTKRSNDYIAAMQKSDEKFNPADIMNRKELQEAVMEKYNANTKKNFAQELYNFWIQEEWEKEITITYKKKTGEWILWTEYETKSKSIKMKDAKLWYADRNREKLIKDFWFTEDEIEEIKEISNVDLNEIVKMDWAIDPEDGLRYMLDQFINGTADYTDLMRNEYVRKLFNDSLSKVFDKKNMKAWEEYFSIAEDGTFILRQEWLEMSAMEKLLARFTTRGNVMNKDKETQWILERLSKVRKTGYIHTNTDFKKILKNNNLAISDKWYVGLESYLSMTKKAINDLSDKINRNERSAVIQDIVNKIFFNVSDSAIDARLNREDVRPLYDLLLNYKKEFWRMRQELWLWDHWNLVFTSVDFGKNWADKLWNRITWMWSYLSNEDIMRLSQKYDASKTAEGWVNWVWKRFTQDILYNARWDKSDGWLWIFFNWLNKLSQRFVIARNYNAIANLPKAWQQMASNLLHSKWIRASTSIWGDPEVDKFLDRIQKSTAQNFWFDLYWSEWIFWINKWWKDWEKWWQWWKKLSWGNYMQWMKKVFSTNALMLWDMATKNQALKSSLALAMDDIYKVWWIDGVKNFEQKFDAFQEFLKKYDLKEWDFLDRERYSRKIENITTPKIGSSYEEVSKNYNQKALLREQNEMWNFYHNEYAPFMGKARNSMWVFFVMDDIGELGSIDFVDKNKFLFWLMKWATGKTGEYGFDLASEFAKNWFTPKGVWKTMTSPIVKRAVNELWEWAHAMWEIEKMTNHEFTWMDWVKATVVPVAWIAMLFWDSIYKAAMKNYSDIEDFSDFAEASWKTLKDVVEDLVKDRAFIYAWVFGSDAWQAWTTANVVAPMDDSKFYKTFIRTFMRKWNVNSPRYKFTHISTAWYKTDGIELLNPGTMLAEMWLNQNSSRRELLSNISEKIYNLGQFYYDENWNAQRDILSWIPVLSNFSNASADLWVLVPELEERMKQSWVKAFLNSTASSSELITLIDKNEKNYIMNSKEVKEQINKMWMSWKEISEEDALEVMFRAWKYDLDLQSWKTVIDSLNKEDQRWRWEYALWYAAMPDDDKEELKRQFDELYQKWVVDLNKWEVVSTTMFDDFIKAASKYGGTMSMGWYMEAFMSWMKSRLREAYWLKAKEVTRGWQWDDWYWVEEIDFSQIQWTKVWDYIDYATTIREMEKQMIINNWDWISREKNVGINLVNKYIENDNENGFQKYTSQISQEQSNLSKMVNIKLYDEVQKEQWLPGLVYPLAYQEKKAMDNYNLAISKAKDPEEAANITAQFLKIQTELAWMADKYIDNPIAATLVKVSLAAGTIPFADTLKEKNPELLEKVVDIIWEKAINNVLNVLTDSPTVSVADAFELATWYNAHEGTGWKWKRWSIPSAKARENYVNKMLIPNYNKAKAAAAGGSGWWSGSLPKFSTYGRAKDGSIVSSQNPVATRKVTTPSYTTDEPKPKVDMTPLPVAEWRVIWWKYSARAIQNAKVYSRRIGR